MQKDGKIKFNVTQLNEKAAFELRRYVNAKYAQQKYERHAIAQFKKHRNLVK